jgi:3-oxoacyl-[acyl-carrier protein] reductase
MSAVNLYGRVALVTGGGTGLGRAISLELAEAGCHVAVNYSRSRREAEETVEELRGLGSRSVAIQADVSDDSAVRRMVGQVVADLGGLDVLVNNAATTHYLALADLDGISDEMWDAVFGVNLKGPFYCARAAAPYLRPRAGKIVNIVSNSAFRPSSSSIPYTVSKAALVMLTKTLAAALAPDIQVNAVAPGRLATRWFEQHVPPEERARIVARGGPPPPAIEEVARTVVFLARTDSITGHTILVDRGMTEL